MPAGQLVAHLQSARRLLTSSGAVQKFVTLNCVFILEQPNKCAACVDLFCICDGRLSSSNLSKYEWYGICDFVVFSGVEIWVEICVDYVPQGTYGRSLLDGGPCYDLGLDLGLVLYECLLPIPPSGTPIISSNTLGSNTLGSNTLGSNTLGSNTLCSNTLGSNTLGSNTLGSNTLGSNTLGSNTLGSNTLGSNTLGSNTLGSNTLGSNTLGSNTLGSNTLGSNTLGSNTLGSNTLGSNTLGSNTLGRNTLGSCP